MVLFGGIVLLYRADLRALREGTPLRQAPLGRLGRTWNWLWQPRPIEARHITMNCPVCRRPVEVPSWQRPGAHAMYPEELIALCRDQNGTTCGPFYDYLKGPLGIAHSSDKRTEPQGGQ